MNKVGIVGLGFVGGAIYHSLLYPHSTVVYDKYKGIGKKDDILDTDFVFICVPTPGDKDGSQNIDELRDILDYLVVNDYSGIVVLKSTTLFLSIKSYINVLNIVINPEFLNARNAIKDMMSQDYVVLGGRADLRRAVYRMYIDNTVLHPAPIYCTAEEACLIKYMHNVYHAYKVLFWNYVCEITNGNHRKIFDAYSKITGNTNEMAQVAADGKMGFGGACFPKDVSAIHSERSHSLTKFIKEYNDRLRHSRD